MRNTKLSLELIVKSLQSTIGRLEKKYRQLGAKISFFVRESFRRHATVKAVIDQFKCSNKLDQAREHLASLFCEVNKPESVTTFSKKYDKKVFKMFKERLDNGFNIVESGEKVTVAFSTGEMSLIGAFELFNGNDICFVYYHLGRRDSLIRKYQNQFNSKQHALFEAIGIALAMS